MHEHQPVGKDPEVLPEPVAAQLLKRAVELDAARDGARSIAQLRAAAAEAGISSEAFEAALAELQGAGERQVAEADVHLRRRSRLVLVAWLAAVLIALAALFFTRMVVPAVAPDERSFPS